MSADTHTHIHQLMSYELVYTSIHSSIMCVPTVNNIYNVAHVHFTTCCSLLCYFYLTKDHIGNKCFFMRFICYPLIKQYKKKEKDGAFDHENRVISIQLNASSRTQFDK